MSQSPTDSKSFNSLMRYRQGWKALNRLLHEERSFSGNEKNCAFLNMQNGKFAAISSVSGLDFNDDSRALALCDWDFDGKVDLWTSARTAPRVRLLHNENKNAGHFVSVQLQGNGTTTNRDAIGARVEIVTDAKEKTVLTLHAGDGFLTQSSRWMHFGLGEVTAIKEVRVRWPGGTAESFSGAETDRFYILKQGTGKVVAWNPPPSKSLRNAQPQQKRPSSQTTRIVPPYRLPLPAIHYTAAAGQQQLQIERPSLVCVWSASCPTCVHELSRWAKQRAAFQGHGLDVVAVCADVDASPEQVVEREKLLSEMGFTFRSVTPIHESIQQLDYYQRALMDLWQTMPVPCSFLLDELGRVIAIYKGPVELEQIWSDLALADADSEAIRAAALPFAGRWGMSVPIADPMRVSSQLVDHRSLNGAIDYLQQYLDTVGKAGGKISKTQQADVLFMKSVLLESQGKPEAAVQALVECRTLNPDDHRIRKALAKAYLKLRNFPAAEVELKAAIKINPNDLSSRRDLGIALVQQSKADAAIEQLNVVVEQRPRDELGHFHLATALRKSGDWKQAIASYQRAVAIRPNFLLASNNLAWILATHPDSNLRDGELAAQIAEQMCQQSKFSQPTFLDTLAAAYAENGDFDKALQVMDRMTKLFEKAGKQPEKGHAERRNLYQQKKPFRDAM